VGNDYNIVAVADSFGDESLERGDIFTQVLWGSGVANRGKLFCMHGIAGILELGDDGGEAGGCVPRAGGEDDLGLGGHGAKLIKAIEVYEVEWREMEG
jgi:hypothetical protein